MDPTFAEALMSYGWIGAAIGAGASLLGGLLQNTSAKSQAADQMAFQERMSNTSYQRGMKDMKRAGLNPILAYKTSGATSPSGAMAPIINPAKDVPANLSTSPKEKASTGLSTAQRETVDALRAATVDEQIANAESAQQRVRIAAPDALKNDWILQGMLSGSNLVTGIFGGNTGESQAETYRITKNYLGKPGEPAARRPHYTKDEKVKAAIAEWERQKAAQRYRHKTYRSRSEVPRKPYYTQANRRKYRPNRYEHLRSQKR